jgi:UDP-N-acetylglucosamine acyltransferase
MFTFGHDVCVGDRVVMANNVMCGGHVHIGNDITIAGGVGINQFTSVGSLSFISALSRVLHDVPPFMIVEGQPSKPRCVNTVGLKRNGYSADDIKFCSRLSSCFIDLALVLNPLVSS